MTVKSPQVRQSVKVSLASAYKNNIFCSCLYVELCHFNDCIKLKSGQAIGQGLIHDLI